MDGDGFDSLARSMALQGSRRAFLGSIAGGFALLLSGRRALAIPPDGKGPKPIGKKCNKHHQCATGYCNPVTGACACAVNADCDDGNPCTYDVCGDSSHQCFNDPIPGCSRCDSGEACPPDCVCCDGRCCPAGNSCGSDAAGRGTCCAPCTAGLSCCDEYGPQEFHRGNCIHECGFCCTGGNGRCEIDAHGIVTNMSCVLPGISR